MAGIAEIEPEVPAIRGPKAGIQWI